MKPSPLCMVFMCMWFPGKPHPDISKCQDGNWYPSDSGFEHIKNVHGIKEKRKRGIEKKMKVSFKIKFYF